MRRRLRWSATALVGSLTTTSVATFAQSAEHASTTGSVFATVAQSEWCATGTVFVDLGTGQYLLTPAANRRVCDEPQLDRPVENGSLTPAQLDEVRLAYHGAVGEGLTVPECRRGPPPRIVVSNGGPRVLVVTAGPYTLVAREELGCWTAAADRLHRVLDQMFRPPLPPAPRD